MPISYFRDFPLHFPIARCLQKRSKVPSNLGRLEGAFTDVMVSRAVVASQENNSTQFATYLGGAIQVQ
jgi:hypothetical protein